MGGGLEDPGRMERREMLNIASTKIGDVYAEIVKAVLGVDDEQLKLVEDYVSHQESIGPLFHPTFYAHQGGFQALDEVKKRVGLIRYCRTIILPKKEKRK